jgi:Protein of unknown function (DUF669)
MSRENPRRLSDILNGQSSEELSRRFDETEAAPEFTPVPVGEYQCDFVHGELCVSHNGNTGYAIHLEISEGEYRGRRIWHTAWLTESAMRYSKRDLAKLGIHNLEQCEKPVPLGIFCTVKVVVRTDDDGTQRNRVTHIEAGGQRPDPMGDPDFGGEKPKAPSLGGAA